MHDRNTFCKPILLFSVQFTKRFLFHSTSFFKTSGLAHVTGCDLQSERTVLAALSSATCRKPPREVGDRRDGAQFLDRHHLTGTQREPQRQLKIFQEPQEKCREQKVKLT